MTTTFKLERRLDDGYGTFGRLFNPAGEEIGRIVEKPWRNNIKKDSCIPEGIYPLEYYPAGKRFYPKYRKIFAKQGNEKGMIQVMNVPGRTHILIHRGNYPRNSWGCLLTNLSVGRDKKSGKLMGYDSTVAYKRIYPLIAAEMDKGEVRLQIVNRFKNA